MTDQERRDAIIEGLKEAYWSEVETALNFIAHSTNLDGVRAEEIKQSLAADVTEEIGHSQTLATRIKQLGGSVPGSMEFAPTQTSLQPVEDTTDVVSSIKGVIDAENQAISVYNRIIKLCDGFDYVTQDMCIAILADEEEHRTLFEGFLKEYERRS